MKLRTAVSCIALAIVASCAEARTFKPSSFLATLSKAPQSLLKEQNGAELVALIDEQLVIRGGADDSGLKHRLKLGFYFGLWYALNIFYNSTFFQRVCKFAKR